MRGTASASAAVRNGCIANAGHAVICSRTACWIGLKPLADIERHVEDGRTARGRRAHSTWSTDDHHVADAGKNALLQQATP